MAPVASVKPPEVSVVVCTYNRAEMLALSLASLTAMQTLGEFSYEMVVVDDASTDGTAATIQAISQGAPIPLHYVRGEGKGVARARNQGLEAAAGTWIAFFDDDQLAEPHWLLDMWTLSRKTGARLVGGRRLLALPQDSLRQLPPFCRALLGQEDWGDVPLRCSRQNTPAAGHALIKREVFEIVGKFDESLTRGGEDLDFFRRVRRQGLDVWYAPQAVSYHMIPPYRLQNDYLVWNSARGGECFADRDNREWHLGKVWISCLARASQALLIHLPLMIYATLAGHKTRALGRKCQIWRTCGYALTTMSLTFPGLVSSQKLHAWLEFRKERNFAQKEQEYQSQA